MAGAGSTAVSAAQAAYAKGGYVLAVEGAIPTGSYSRACTLWPGTTALSGIKQYAQKAGFILAVGSCAAYGGVVAGKPNPTRAKGVKSATKTSRTVIHIPGCPAHPDWVVGTVAYLLKYGKAPSLDSNGRPKLFYAQVMHDLCPLLSEYDSHFGRRARHGGGRSCLTCHSRDDHEIPDPRTLSGPGCLFALGCEGLKTHCDCPTRKWNGGAAGQPGVNWCVGAGSPCIGCTEPKFPDAMSPFYTLSGPGVDDDEEEDGDD